MSALLGSIEQADDRTGTLHISEYTGPRGSPRLQLTSPHYDIMKLDRAAVRDLHKILGSWLDGGLEKGDRAS